MAVVAAGAAGLVVARGAGDTETAAITGCYDRTTGALRVIDPGSAPDCAESEEEISWNREGPPATGAQQASPNDSDEAGDGHSAREAQVWLWGSGGGLVFVVNCIDYGFVTTGGTCPTSATGAVTQSAVTLDSARYPSNAKVRLEGSLNARPGARVCVRLFDITAGAAVEGSDACVNGSSSGGSFRELSSPFPLAGGAHDYAIQSLASGGVACMVTQEPPLTTVPPLAPQTTARYDPIEVPPVAPSGGTAAPPPAPTSCTDSALIRVRLIISW